MTKVQTSPGAELAALRHVSKKQCPVCNEFFMGIKRKRYCSEACKQRAKRMRLDGNHRKN